MSGPAIKSALAIGFDHASETLSLVLNGAGLTLTTTVPVVTGARVLLADSTHDLLQVFQAALNATPSLPGGTTFSVSISAATGKVSIACTGDTFKMTGLASSAVGAALGWTSAATPFAAGFTADEQPKYLILAPSRTSPGWSPKTPMAAASTAGGASYGTTSATTRWEDEIVFDFLPTDPAARTLVDSLATPWEPAAAFLASLGSHAAPWSVSDCLAVALGQTCALARGNFQALCTSTSERYDLVAISGADLAAPRSAYQVPGWEAYRRWTVSLIRQTTPTGTRA